MRIGISSCLIGERVRYDGRHKRNSLVVDLLLPNVELIPVCPEVELGMGVPRPPLMLIRGSSGEIRMITRKGGDQDFTEPMIEFAAGVCTERLTGICGYVFKAKSPSCGAGDVPVGDVHNNFDSILSFGLYAQEVRLNMPYLPITDEINLKTPDHVHHFLERAFVYQSWHEKGVMTSKGIKNFNCQFRAHALARSEEFAVELDQIAQDTTGSSLTVAQCYIAALMNGLDSPPTETGHARALRYELDNATTSVSRDIRSKLEIVLCDFEHGTIDRRELRNILERELPEGARSSSYLRSSLRNLSGGSIRKD